MHALKISRAEVTSHQKARWRNIVTRCGFEFEFEFGGRVVVVSLNQAGRQNKLKSKSKTNMLFQHTICVCVCPTRNDSLRLQIILICKCITNAECGLHYCIHIFSRVALHFQGDQVNGQIYPRASSGELIWICLIY